MVALYIIIGIVVILAIWFMATYNGLITLRNRVRESWSEIDVQLKRRSSLIPNLVETVKGYAKHEKSVFEDVTKARAALVGAKTPGEAADANNQLSGALKSLFAVAEAYPQLKASENFKELQEELSDTENKVAASRQFYNTNVLDLNNTIQSMPTVVIANMFGFQQADFFQASEEEKADVKVQF